MEQLPQSANGSAFRSRRSPILLRGTLFALAGLGIVGGLSHSQRGIRGGDLAISAVPPPVDAPRPGPALDYESINTLRGALLAALAPRAVEAEPATPDIADTQTTTPFAQQESSVPAEPDTVGNRLAQTVPLPVPRPP